MLPAGMDIEYRFSACEMAELAAEVEAKGSEYYGRLAAEVRAEPLRDMCRYFAEQEDNHKRTFQMIARHYQERSIEHAYSLDIATMLRRPLRKIVSTISKRKDRLLEGGGLVGCLNLAREVEETSIAVYGHMRRKYAPHFSDLLARIVREEEQHLRMVLDMLDSLPNEIRQDKDATGKDPQNATTRPIDGRAPAD